MNLQLHKIKQAANLARKNLSKEAKNAAVLKKYKEKYSEYHAHFAVIEKSIKSIVKGEWSAKMVLELGYALVQIVWSVSKNLAKAERAEFIVSVLEYFVEVVIGWDLPDHIWDYVLVAIEWFLKYLINKYGKELEGNTYTTFLGKRVFSRKIVPKKRAGK